MRSFNKRLKERFLPVVTRRRFPERRLLGGGRGGRGGGKHFEKKKRTDVFFKCTKRKKKDLKSQKFPLKRKTQQISVCFLFEFSAGLVETKSNRLSAGELHFPAASALRCGLISPAGCSSVSFQLKSAAVYLHISL